MKTTTERRKRFEKMVAKAESDFQRSPDRYKRKVLWLAALGYSVIFAMLFGLLSLLAGLVWASVASTALLIILIKNKIIFILIPMIWVMLRSLWVKIDMPQGYELNPKQAPKLFALLESLRVELKTAKIRQVIVIPDYNAAVQQTPRFGFFGGHKCTLFIGLELLLSMSVDEFKAVLAHELGHLSGNHSKFNGWIYRMRTIWNRMLTELEKRSDMGAGIMRKFFSWYSPIFNSYSFALARHNEYEADAISVEATCKNTVGQALVNSSVMADYLDKEFWQPFYKRAKISEEPTQAPFSALKAFLSSEDFHPEQLRLLLDKSLKQKTEIDNTHPSLSDRLANIGRDAELPTRASISAAEDLLGNHLDQVISDFDKDWLANNRENWREHYQKTQEKLEKFNELKTTEVSNLEDESFWQLFCLYEEFEHTQEAITLATNYYDGNEEREWVTLHIARLQLQEASEQDKAISLLKELFEKPDFRASCSELLYDHYISENHPKEAEIYLLELEKNHDLYLKAEKERNELLNTDNFKSAELQEDQLSWIKNELSELKGIQKLWICRKVTHYSETPVYLFVIEAKWFNKSDKLLKDFINTIELPHAYLVIVKTGENKKIAKKAISQSQQII